MRKLIVKLFLRVVAPLLFISFLLQGKPSKKKAKGGFDFEDISNKLGNMEDKHHIDQIEFALSETYFKHAKDKEKSKKMGVPIYKDKYNQKEAEALLDDLVDEFNFHVHRRYMKIDKKDYDNLKKIKDPASNRSYVDSMALIYGGLDRDDLKGDYANRKKGNKISRQDLQQILGKAVQQHAGRVQGGIIKDKGLDKPELVDQLKGAIESIKKKYKVTSEEYDTKQMHDSKEVLEKYIKLSREFYSKK